MARIFYYTTTGDIYGVHPGDFDGSLPDDVDFIDVAGPPDRIVWPDTRGEHYCRVQGRVLVISPSRVPLETVERQALRELASEVGASAVAKINVLLGLKP